MNTNQVVHDWLMEHRPEGASHDIDGCEYCTIEASEQEEDVTGDSKIFTQEQHEQLLVSAVEKAATEATAKVDAEILRLNERLEAAEKELAERDETIASLEATISEREEQDRLEALASERVKQVQAVASFSAEQVDARRMTWAKMSEDDFKVYLDDIREVAKNAPKDKEKVPDTELDGTRETAGEDGSETSAIASFFGAGLETAAQL